MQYDNGNHTVDFHEILGILQGRSEVLLKRLQVIVHFGRNQIALLEVLQGSKKNSNSTNAIRTFTNIFAYTRLLIGLANLRKESAQWITGVDDFARIAGVHGAELVQTDHNVGQTLYVLF